MSKEKNHNFEFTRDLYFPTDKDIKAHVPKQPVTIIPIPIKQKESLWEKEMREGLINRVLFDGDERARPR